MKTITRRILFTLIAILCLTTLNAKESKPLKGKTILFVYGGWEGHEPVKCRDIFVPWMEKAGAKVISADNLDVYTDEKVMNKADLIVQCWTMGSLTPEQEKGLISAVRNGKPIAGWHGGLGDSFRGSTEYQFMIGGQWVSHPDNIVDYEVNIVNHDDPVTAGLKDFKMHSERYYMLVDPNVEVLASMCMKDSKEAPWVKGRKMPVVWKTQYGKGRVFYSSLGHVAADFQVPEALEIMKRGICWAALGDEGKDCTEKTCTEGASCCKGKNTDMSIDDIIMSRRSIRKYKDCAISREVLEQIMQNGINAPNGKGIQAYEVRVVADPQLVQQMSDAVVKDMPNVASRPGFRNIFVNAPCVVFIAAAKDYDMSHVDCGLLGENIILSAWSKGIGSCCLGSSARMMLSAPSAKPYLDKLGFSDNYELLYCIALGYPDETPSQKPRKAEKVRFVE